MVVSTLNLFKLPSPEFIIFDSLKYISLSVNQFGQSNRFLNSTLKNLQQSRNLDSFLTAKYFFKTCSASQLQVSSAEHIKNDRKRVIVNISKRVFISLQPNVEVSCGPNQRPACTAFSKNLQTTRRQLHWLVGQNLLSMCRDFLFKFIICERGN